MKDSILLVATATGTHTPALQRAFDLARAAEAPVHVCLCVHDRLIERSATLVRGEFHDLAVQQFVDEHRPWLDRLVARWRADGLDASGEVLWAPRPEDAILGQVLARAPSLVIKDVGDAPALRRITFTALDWKLARQCPAPLMLVHGHSAHLPRHVVAAVDTTRDLDDPGRVNDVVLRAALKVADWADAEAGVAHAFPCLPFVSAATPHAFEGAYAQMKAADRKAFEEFADAHQVPEAARHWLEGDPVNRLVEFARAEVVDLLVLGATYRSTFDRLLLGSTAETLLYQLPCDLLLVKPDAFAAALTQNLQRRAA